MSTEPTIYRDGQTATNPKTGQRVVFRGGMWVKDTSYKPQPVRAKPTAQDLSVLAKASDRARTERDAMQSYDAAAKAVETMGTGPGLARFLDAITPEDPGGSESGFAGLFTGMGDALGAAIGYPLRALVSKDTMVARDHLRTVGAKAALAGSQQMKGAASDKDTALMRLAGVSPYKTVEENRRIIRDAKRSSGLEGTRAMMTSRWIGRYGSLGQPSENGMTFEEALARAERYYARNLQRQREERKMPKPPPSRAKSRTMTIDLDGNVIP